MNSDEFRSSSSGIPFEEIEVPLLYGQPKRKFSNIDDLTEYIDQQNRGWTELMKVNSLQTLKPSQLYFSSISQAPLDYIQDVVINRVYHVNAIRDLKATLKNCENVFEFDSKEVDFLVRLHEVNADAMQSAFMHLTRRSGRDYVINTANNAFGIVNAILFQKEKENLYLFDPAKETKDVRALRSLTTKNLKEIERERIRLEKEIDDQLKNSHSKIEKAHSSILDMNEQLRSDEKKQFEKFDNESRETLVKLKETYKAKLMLEEPVKHWETRGKELKDQALIWIGITVVTTIVGLLLFGNLIYSLSYENVAEQLKNPAISIRWSIISVFSLAIIVFLIRTFTKLALSNYHLYRDAQERKHLTYLYLSLKTQGDIPDADRQIILQSLFSRADTGLLKGESGPSMPNTSWEKIANQ